MTDALELLRIARQSYGQRQIAEALGVHERTVARWETGHTTARQWRRLRCAS